MQQHPPTKKYKINESSVFSKIAKNSEFEIFKFFDQNFRFSLKGSPKIKGVDSAYIGSTDLSEYPYPDRIR